MRKMIVSRRTIYALSAVIMTLVLLITGSCTRVRTSTATTTPVTNTTSQTTVNSTPATTTNSTTMSTTTTTTTYTYTETTPLPLAGEATEFMGHKLTPISAQLNNAIKGTEYINQDTYHLTVDGLVDHPLSLSYTDLQAYPQIDQVMDLDCVEGWSFTAKWSGPSLNAIFADAGVQSGALIAIFYSVDVPLGFTSLDLKYITDNNIILGMKDNDIVLPPERGFPFQVVAMNKFGYKWAKWVTRIELSSDTNFRGFWETNGYNNNADINGPAF